MVSNKSIFFFEISEDQDEVRKYVPAEIIRDFIETLLYFLDFKQKERFNKLKKLRASQAALPIAQYK